MTKICEINIKGNPILNLVCLVLCLKICIPKKAPKPPDIKAEIKSVRSDMRLKPYIALNLSTPIIINVVKFQSVKNMINTLKVILVLSNLITP